MSQLDPLIIQLLERVAPIIIPILAAAISGYALLRTHHARVEEELRLRIEIDRFQQRQAAYEKIWDAVLAVVDENMGFMEEANWRKIRAAQTKGLLVGSEEVTGRFLAIMTAFGRKDPTQQDLQKASLEITRLAKELWNEMRKDLYGAKPLPPDAIVFISPPEMTKQALRIWLGHRSLLRKRGIHDLETLSKIDESRISQETGIALEELRELKSVANRELRLQRETKEIK